MSPLIVIFCAYAVFWFSWYQKDGTRPGPVFYIIHGFILFFIIVVLVGGSGGKPSPADEARRKWQEKRERDNRDVETLIKAAKIIDSNK